MITKTDAELLAEAKSALHLLLTGKSPRVVVDQNGERVEFTAANRGALQQYVAELEATVNPATTLSGPLRAFM